MSNIWQYHNSKMQELKAMYHKVGKQTQNKLQEIFDSFKFSSDNLYNIADIKTKSRVDTYIEEWKDKGLLTGYFGTLAKNIYGRTRVKNSEILELLIYGAYIEEQNKLQETELNILKEVANYYYIQGQEEVIQAQNKKKKASIILDAIFLALISMPNYNGLTWEQYIETTIQYNAQQMYKQVIIDIQQQKELKIQSDEFQRIINQQNNQKLCINDNKISGAVDLNLIGINNQAKTEGIKSIDDDAKVRFMAVIDGKETDMCHSLDGQVFYINKDNEFDRYYGETQKDLRIQRIKCKGLVLGLNLPPISHHFHFCRSTITYQVPPVEKEEKTEYNIVDYIRKENLSNNKDLNSNIEKAIELLPENIQELIKDTKFKISDNNSYYNRKTDEIYLLEDSNEYEVLHEIGHAIETKLDILHDNKYIEIQQKDLDIENVHTDNMSGYSKENEFWLDGDKFISDYQRRVYEQDIDGNYKLNYTNYTFNTKTLGEYFSEGFRCYFEDNKLLKKKDISLYNYIKEILK